jgi:holo-[acyl-carrier protein] synthase
VILGCGVDLMEIGRFERDVARRGDSVIGEVFSAGEQAWCGRRAAAGYAMAFAAKEALFKALGTGKVGRMAWRDVEVTWPAGAARAEMRLAGETAAEADRMGVTAVHVAVARSREYGIAWVLIEGTSA